MKFHALVGQHAQELAELIVKENGKNITEALADGRFLVSHILTLCLAKNHGSNIPRKSLCLPFFVYQWPREMKQSNMLAPFLNWHKERLFKCLGELLVQIDEIH